MDFYTMEKMEQIHKAYFYQCAKCGEPSNQLAHIIPKRKTRIKKYSKDVIHHPLNLVPVCSLKCNDSCDIGQSVQAERFLVDLINYVIESKEDWRDFIEERDAIIQFEGLNL